MTRFVLASAGDLSLQADTPIVPRDALPAVGSAIEILRRVETIREAVVRASASRFALAREEGLAQGRAEGRQEAAAALGAALASLDAVLRADRAAHEARVVGLALAIVERIAGELGDAAVVTALARRALADLDPDVPVRLRVHPSVATAMAAAARAAGPPVLEVLADPGLDPLDCEIQSDDGVVEAGLAVQLVGVRAALERGDARDA
jgi:flagellar biosynthesis/type III secretory pathway protein FliH